MIRLSLARNRLCREAPLKKNGPANIPRDLAEGSLVDRMPHSRKSWCRFLAVFAARRVQRIEMNGESLVLRRSEEEKGDA
jgi:hypothetical protein